METGQEAEWKTQRKGKSRVLFQQRVRAGRRSELITPKDLDGKTKPEMGAWENRSDTGQDGPEKQMAHQSRRVQVACSLMTQGLRDRGRRTGLQAEGAPVPA